VRGNFEDFCADACEERRRGGEEDRPVGGLQGEVTDRKCQATSHNFHFSQLFDKLRATNPAALGKLEVIEGDMMELRLGMSESDVARLKNCTHIFHCAASVRFDDPLKDAVLMNTRGTREVCNLALKMPNLKALVHVSTAFIQPKTYSAEEIFYPADLDWRQLIAIAETFDHNFINSLEKK
jgi:alcohol-forming fatty acyl-CoA reductase